MRPSRVHFVTPSRMRAIASSTAPCPSQSRAAQHARFEDEREPLLRSQHLGGFELAQGSLGLAAIEVKHRGKSESSTQRERVGDPLGQRQRLSDACERLLGISEQPFGLSAK